jgi:hypothetical protein
LLLHLLGLVIDYKNKIKKRERKKNGKPIWMRSSSDRCSTIRTQDR